MATNAVYTKLGTAKVWKQTGGDAAFTPAGVATNAGRLGGRLDLGTWPRPAVYRWYAETQCQATPTVGNVIDVYLSFWHDETTPGDPDGDVGAADAAFATENNLRNLKRIGSIVVRAATADTVFTGSGLIYLPFRYVSPVWWNKSGATLTADNAEHWLSLTPVFDDIQAAA